MSCLKIWKVLMKGRKLRLSGRVSAEDSIKRKIIIFVWKAAQGFKRCVTFEHIIHYYKFNLMKFILLIPIVVSLVSCQLFENLNKASSQSFLQVPNVVAPPTIFQSLPDNNKTIENLPKFIETESSAGNSAYDQGFLSPISSNNVDRGNVALNGNYGISDKLGAPIQTFSEPFPVNQPVILPNNNQLDTNPKAFKNNGFGTMNPAINGNIDNQLYNEFLNENHGGTPLPDFIREDIQPKIFREPANPGFENMEAMVIQILRKNGISLNNNKTVILDPEIKIRVKNTSLTIKDIEKLVSFNAKLMRKCGENLEFCMIKDNALDEELASDLEISNNGENKGKEMNFLEIDNAKEGEMQNEIEELLGGDGENEVEEGNREALEDFDLQ